MAIVVAASVPRLPLFPQIWKKNQKSARPQLLHCSKYYSFTSDSSLFCFRRRSFLLWGNIGESTSLSRDPEPSELGSLSDMEVHQRNLKSIDNEKEEKPNDIWQLFLEAQQNILYLNKQRLLAMEELERLKIERNLLLDRVEQLEMKNQANVRRDKFTISSELLLRIDSLVLNGVISSMEASDLRRLIIDARESSVDDLYGLNCKNDAELLAELHHFSKNSKKNGFHIIHICTEMSPVVSEGPLASYITDLSSALQRKGNVVEVILPKYSCLNLDEVQGLREVETEFYSYFNGQLHGNRIWTGVVYGIGVTFIQPVHYSSLFSHDKVYGYSNDFERFTYFSRASLDYLVKSGKKPDVLHVHNWHTSIVGPLFWDVFVSQGFEGTRILLTCQGFDSQCLEQPEKLALCGLDPSRLLRPDRLQDDNKSHLVNILKGGVVYSNKVIIMSSIHTKGRIVSAFGHGLELTLDIHKEKLVIAPRGFDKSTWDPSCDNILPQSYSADDMKGKSVCKVVLQRHLDLPEGASKILVGCIYPDILDADIEKLKTLVWMASRRGVQFIFMGSSKSPSMRRELEIFEEELKDENVRFIDEYDEELSHLIISGSDIMICPSFDDPLLQVPLKAINYGAAPVPLHSADSRFRLFGDDESTTFSQYINHTFANMSLGQAIDEIKNNPSQWNARMIDAMGKDFSWDSECIVEIDIEQDILVHRKSLQSFWISHGMKFSILGRKLVFESLLILQYDRTDSSLSPPAYLRTTAI
ncbi:putative starch synthase 4, chloroplastic/amyloplastic [Sesamum angolense]|uniref:starch synthase n=1 Tax=Sesamum angolense TaxID=2727404 RepID=A0AAE1WHP7_9LAMI|nr:putative starch synthase 4, chloroplastic/amyloplastic [Sesamum angolense]